MINCNGPEEDLVLCTGEIIILINIFFTGICFTATLNFGAEFSDLILRTAFVQNYACSHDIYFLWTSGRKPIQSCSYKFCWSYKLLQPEVLERNCNDYFNSFISIRLFAVCEM